MVIDTDTHGSDHDVVRLCGAKSFWLGPNSAELICGRSHGHDGTHIAFFPNVSVGFTDRRADGTVVQSLAGAATA